jgi:methionyl-tRNA formyltransferase
VSVIRIVFLGTPDFAQVHLESLLKDEHFEVVGVVTQPDRPSGRHLQSKPSPVKVLAQQKNIPVLSPDKVDSVLPEIEKWQAEAAVVVAFGQILSKNFLDLYPQKVVNIHASLLPQWRGAAPLQRAIMADKKTGVTLQVMAQKLDAGDVLGIRALEITDEMDAIELHNQLQPLGCELLNIEFMDYLRGHLVPESQDESQVTYARKIKKDEGLISWHQSSVEIFNQIKGLILGPGAYTSFQGKRVKILKAKLDTEKSQTPGMITRLDSDGIVVSCGKNSLKLLRVQPESRGGQTAAEFIRGTHLKTGDVFK